MEEKKNRRLCGKKKQKHNIFHLPSINFFFPKKSLFINSEYYCKFYNSNFEYSNCDGITIPHTMYIFPDFNEA